MKNLEFLLTEALKAAKRLQLSEANSAVEVLNREINKLIAECDDVQPDANGEFQQTVVDKRRAVLEQLEVLWQLYSVAEKRPELIRNGDLDAKTRRAALTAARLIHYFIADEVEEAANSGQASVTLETDTDVQTTAILATTLTSLNWPTRYLGQRLTIRTGQPDEPPKRQRQARVDYV